MGEGNWWGIPRGEKEVRRREEEQDLGVNPPVLAWKSQFGEVHSIIRAWPWDLPISMTWLGDNGFLRVLFTCQVQEVQLPSRMRTASISTASGTRVWHCRKPPSSVWVQLMLYSKGTCHQQTKVRTHLFKMFFLSLLLLPSMAPRHPLNENLTP